jgi:hypothetical protein
MQRKSEGFSRKAGPAGDGLRRTGGQIKARVTAPAENRGSNPSLSSAP